MYRVVSCNFCGDYQITTENLKECSKCGSLNLTKNWHSKLDKILSDRQYNSEKVRQLIKRYAEVEVNKSYFGKVIILNGKIWRNNDD